MQQLKIRYRHAFFTDPIVIEHANTATQAVPSRESVKRRRDSQKEANGPLFFVEVVRLFPALQILELLVFSPKQKRLSFPP